MGRDNRNSKGKIDGVELTMMFLILLITVAVLGFFYGWVYNQTPEYLEIWGQNFAWHAVSPYLGTAFVGFVLLLVGIKAKSD